MNRKRKQIDGCRYNERQNTNTEGPNLVTSENERKRKGSTRLTHTGLIDGLEHLKIETRLIDEMFESVSKHIKKKIRSL
jgi:hypothetical protein